QEPSQSQRLAIDAGSGQPRQLGGTCRVAIQELAQEAAKVIERQSMRPERFDQPVELGASAAYTVLLQQGACSLRVEAIHFDAVVATASECIEIGERESARHQRNALAN